MAVTTQAGIADQFGLLALARWQAFKNSLRRKQKRYELVFTFLYWLGGAGIVLGGGAFSFFLTYIFIQRGFTILGVLFWVFLAVWQAVPIVLEGQSPALDFREIARY